MLKAQLHQIADEYYGLTDRIKELTDTLSRWVNQLVARRGVHKACMALAARLARIAWVLLHRQETYKAMP